MLRSQLARVDMADAGTIQQTIPHDGSVEAIAFSKDSKRLATGGSSTKVLLRALEAGASVDIAVKGFVSSLAFSPDGAKLAIADLDQVLVYDSTQNATAEEQALWKGAIEASQSVNYVTFSPDGTSVIAATDTLVAVLNSQTGEKIRSFPLVQTIADVDLSADGSLIAVAIDERHGGDHHNAGSARVLDVAGGTERTQLTPPPDNAVYAVAFFPDGKAVLCGSADGFTRVFSSQDGTEVVDRKDIEASHLAVDPMGRWVILGDADGFARVFDRKLLAERSRAEHSGAVTHVAFAPNGKVAASTGIDNVLKVFRVDPKKELYGPSTPEVHSMEFSPDSRWLALGHLESAVVYSNGAP
jgi:WD40 repeat protein